MSNLIVDGTGVPNFRNARQRDLWIAEKLTQGACDLLQRAIIDRGVELPQCLTIGLDNATVYVTAVPAIKKALYKRTRKAGFKHEGFDDGADPCSLEAILIVGGPSEQADPTAEAMAELAASNDPKDQALSKQVSDLLGPQIDPASIPQVPPMGHVKAAIAAAHERDEGRGKPLEIPTSNVIILPSAPQMRPQTKEELLVPTPVGDASKATDAPPAPGAQ